VGTKYLLKLIDLLMLLETLPELKIMVVFTKMICIFDS